MTASLYARYKDWVKRNNSLLSVWETGRHSFLLDVAANLVIDLCLRVHMINASTWLAGLSSLTWLLPDRFSESEIALEAIHTAINLVSTFHDSIINESPGGEGGAKGTELVFLLGALQQVGACNPKPLHRVGAKVFGTWELERCSVGAAAGRLSLVMRRVGAGACPALAVSRQRAALRRPPLRAKN